MSRVGVVCVIMVSLEHTHLLFGYILSVSFSLFKKYYMCVKIFRKFNWLPRLLKIMVSLIDYLVMCVNIIFNVKSKP